MFSLATSRPAASCAATCAGLDVAGPTVPTIFARRLIAGTPSPVALTYPSMPLPRRPAPNGRRTVITWRCRQHLTAAPAGPSGGHGLQRLTAMITLDRVLIDHLVYAVRSLPAAIDDVADRFGVRARAGGKHVGLGTHNALLALGPRTYLEIIAPDPGQPEPSLPRPFGLDRVMHGRLAGWALACDDIDTAALIARLSGPNGRTVLR